MAFSQQQTEIIKTRIREKMAAGARNEWERNLFVTAGQVSGYIGARALFDHYLENFCRHGLETRFTSERPVNAARRLRRRVWRGVSSRCRSLLRGRSL
jgi:hypothetical protein